MRALRVFMVLPLVIVAAGCGVFGPEDPHDALAGALAPLQEGNYTWMSGVRGQSRQGIVHVPSRSASIVEMSPPTEVRTLVVGDIRYTWSRFGPAPSSEKDSGGAAEPVPNWRSEDLTRYKAGKDGLLHGGEPDVTGVTELLGRAVDARWEGEKIVGTVNVWEPEMKSFNGAFGSFLGLQSLGASIPFEVTVDGDGRLSRLTLSIPKVVEEPADLWALQITSWGDAQAVRPPPADRVTPSEDWVYEQVNGENGY